MESAGRSRSFDCFSNNPAVAMIDLPCLRIHLFHLATHIPELIEQADTVQAVEITAKILPRTEREFRGEMKAICRLSCTLPNGRRMPENRIMTYGSMYVRFGQTAYPMAWSFFPSCISKTILVWNGVVPDIPVNPPEPPVNVKSPVHSFKFPAHFQ